MFKFIERIRSKAFQQGQEKARRSFEEHRLATQRQDMERFVGMPVILITNEWENPVIGVGQSVESFGENQLFLLWIKDYLTGDLVTGTGPLMAYTPQRLNAILSLDPFQLWSLTGQLDQCCTEYDKAHSGERWTEDEILETLHISGFLRFYQDYLSLHPAVE